MTIDDAGTVSSFECRTVTIGTVQFPYYFGNDCLDAIASQLHSMGADRFVVVTDDRIFAIHGKRLMKVLSAETPITLLSHPPGESMKSLAVLADFLERAVGDGATRSSVVVSFGGGIPGNLAGVVASLLFRGVRLVHIPTTTVAAMDSVLSLKQAINSVIGKNHVGSYYPATAVFTDVSLFQTLPARELRSGLCEMLKNCLAINPSAIPELRAIVDSGRLAESDTLVWLLEASINSKCSVTRTDTYEQRNALVLEYGHTVGHAIELLDHRRRGEEGISHGEAVALGMMVAARVSHSRGWLSAEDVELHDSLVSALGVELAVPSGISLDEVLLVVGDDNKRGYLDALPDHVPFVLLQCLGTPAGRAELPLVPVSFEEIREALVSLCELEVGVLRT